MNSNEAVGRINFMLDVGGSDGFTSADKEALNMAINALTEEITAPPKSNDEHTAAYWMQKTMDAAHEAYDRLKDTVDFKNAIKEAEAIKQRMGIIENKKITNAYRIRQMTDEELAEFLMNADANICDFCDMKYPENCLSHSCEGEDCKTEILKWLKQEVSEDATERTD